MVQLFDIDLLRLTFVFGIVVSVLLYERTHLTTGSLVVPGYIGAQLLNPLALVTTAVNAAVTYFLVSKVLTRFAVVYGRARFMANIVTSVILNLLLGPALSSFTGPGLPVLDTIGYVIPALIAYDMNRQGPKKTLKAVTVAGSIAAIPALVIVVVAPGIVDPIFEDGGGLLPVGEVWFPVVALLSTAVSTTMQANHRLRSGGFVGAMYLGLAATRPVQLVFLVSAAFVTYIVVHHGLKRVMISFGRRKFASMLMIGSTLSWLLLEVVEWLEPGSLGVASLPLAAIFVPALLANDMERTTPMRVCVGGYLAGSATLSLALVLSSVVDQSDRPSWAIPTAVVSTGVIVWPMLATRIGELVRPQQAQPA